MRSASRGYGHSAHSAEPGFDTDRGRDPLAARPPQNFPVLTHTPRGTFVPETANFIYITEDIVKALTVRLIN